MLIIVCGLLMVFLCCAPASAQEEVVLDTVTVVGEYVADYDPTSHCCDYGDAPAGGTGNAPAGPGSVGGFSLAQQMAAFFKATGRTVTQAVAQMMAAQVHISIQIEVVDIMQKDLFHGFGTGPLIGGTIDRMSPPVITNPGDGKPQVRIRFTSTHTCRYIMTQNNRYRTVWSKCVKDSATRGRLWTPKISPEVHYYDDSSVVGEN